MIIYKFGGTSVATSERMKSVADLITRDNTQKVVVLSAVSGTTDMLIRLSKAGGKEAEDILNDMERQYGALVDGLFGEEHPLSPPDLPLKGEQQNSPPLGGFGGNAQRFLASTFDALRKAVKAPLPRDERWFVSNGEILSTNLFALYIQEKNHDAVLIPALDFMRIQHGEPNMDAIRALLPGVLEEAGRHDLYITQGYICRNEHGAIDNLKRGGSDYSATIIGAAIGAKEIQIWTDIDGVHNNDPRVVRNTARIDELTYAEAAELAYFGAKILHPLCVRPAREAGIPIRLLNTLDPNARGTTIHREDITSGTGPKAVAAKDGITAINIRSSHMLMAHGFLKKIFEVFEHHKTSVDMITTAEVAVSLTIDDPTRLDAIVADLRGYGVITVDLDQTIICVVGAFRKDDTGIAIQVLHPLRNIPIRMISSGGSESNISVLIDSKYKQEALEALNAGLFNQ